MRRLRDRDLSPGVLAVVLCGMAVIHERHPPEVPVVLVLAMVAAAGWAGYGIEHVHLGDGVPERDLVRLLGSVQQSGTGRDQGGDVAFQISQMQRAQKRAAVIAADKA